MSGLFLSTGVLVWCIALLALFLKAFGRWQGSKRVDIKNQWVVVTGCDSGFGLGVVESLVQKGANVVACTYSEKGAESAREKGAQLALPFDLTDKQAIADSAQKILEVSHHKLWGVVHNAGVVLPGFIDYQPNSHYHKVMDVNFFAPVALNQLLMPAVKAVSGRIVLVSSVDGIVSLPGNAPYDASKFAIEAYADALRVEQSFWGVKVSVVNPSTMKTPLAMGFFTSHETAWQQMSKQDPEGDWKKAWSEEWLQEYIKVNQPRIETIAQDPNHTVKDLVHALTSKHPKLRYLSGTLAKTLFYALWKMPEHWSFAFKRSTVQPAPYISEKVIGKDE